MRAATVVLIAVLAAPLARAGGAGLATDADQLPWLRFQGRVAISEAPAWRADLAPPPAATGSGGVKLGGASVMGDVYFGSTGSDRAGGFRATSGVLFGARGALWGSPATSPAHGSVALDRRAATPLGDGESGGTLPYVGIGYSSLAAHGGWSFSADLGVMSLAPSNAVRLGRVVGGSQSLDDVVREMRLAPVLQLGVSYSF